MPQKPDKAEVQSARRLVMKRLEEYAIPREEVASVLGVRISTLERWDDEDRLVRRSPIQATVSKARKLPPPGTIGGIIAELRPDPPPDEDFFYKPPHDPTLAPNLAMIVLIRAGYKVPVIGRVLGASQATVYRMKDALEQNCSSPAKVAQMRAYLSRVLKSDRYADNHAANGEYGRLVRRGTTPDLSGLPDRYTGLPDLDYD